VASKPYKIDSLSYISLDEHLGRLTSRDLKQLETSVPLDTLKTVVDLAVDIGREGREGKPVGTMFVIGDTRRVLSHSHPAGFDPVKGIQPQGAKSDRWPSAGGDQGDCSTGRRLHCLP
jgi:hypothetical protein